MKNSKRPPLVTALRNAPHSDVSKRTYMAIQHPKTYTVFATGSRLSGAIDTENNSTSTADKPAAKIMIPSLTGALHEAVHIPEIMRSGGQSKSAMLYSTKPTNKAAHQPAKADGRTKNQRIISVLTCITRMRCPNRSKPNLNRALIIRRSGLAYL